MTVLCQPAGGLRAGAGLLYFLLISYLFLQAFLRAAKLVEIGYNIKMMIQVLLLCPCVLTARVSPPYSGNKRPAARIDRPLSICGGKVKAAYKHVLWTSLLSLG